MGDFVLSHRLHRRPIFMKFGCIVMLSVLSALFPYHALAGGTAGNRMRMLGGEFKVNTVTSGDQIPIHINTQSGEFEITYASNSSNIFTLYAQKIDANGNFVDAPMVVSTYPTSQKTTATDGSYVTVWNNPYDGIYGQVFDVNGSPLTGQFLVQACDRTYPKGYYVGAPSAAVAPDGSIIVTWEQTAPEKNNHRAPSLYDIWAKRLDRFGKPVGKEFMVNSTVQNYQHTPLIGLLENGVFIITWYSIGQDGDGAGTYAQRFILE